MTTTSNILKPTSIFVPRYLKLQEITDEHERAHWVPEEAVMGEDVAQWKNGTITESEKAFIKMILRLFTQADTDICGSYVERLLPVFKNADARIMLLSFAARECTHMKAYKRLNDTLGYDSAEFMSEFLEYSEMREKHEFVIGESSLVTESDIASYTAKQMLSEGVGIFGIFALLLSYSQEGKLPGMVSVNQWSINEESMHSNGLSELFRILVEENPKIINSQFKAGIYETARRIIAIDDAFIDLCFSVGTNNIVTADQAKNYERYVCDYRMQQLGLKPQFGIKSNPIPWMDLITSNTLANFFEATSVQYSKDSLKGEWVY